MLRAPSWKKKLVLPTTRLISTFSHSLSDAKRLHQHLLVRGGLTDYFFTAQVISTYIACDSRSHALSVLERLPPSSPAVFWWNLLIRNAVRRSLPYDALDLYRRMRSLAWQPDHFTFPFVLKASSEVPSYFLGSSIHATLFASGFDANVFVCNAVVAMYGRCGALGGAAQMFDEMRQRGVFDIVSWNSIIAAYVQCGEFRRGLDLFGKIKDSVGLCPDAISLVNLLPACAGVGAALQGKEVHGFALRTGLFEDLFVGNALVDMYAKCEMMDEANRVFEKMKVKDVVSWNTMVTGYSQVGRFEDALILFKRMRDNNIELNVITWSAVIAGYAQRGLGPEAMDVFRKMQFCGSVPNVVTLVSVLSGCATVGALHHGKEIHCYAIKCILNFQGSNPGDNLMVINALVDMYAKCKSFKIARAMFDRIMLKDRGVVTWTVMIGGYAQYGNANDALELFYEMLLQDKPMIPNAFTISCALMACARLGALRSGQQIHAYVLRNRYESVMLFVANCLIDMYSKSGDVDSARLVFNSMRHRNEVSWTSMMTGYGMHGRGEEAVQIFDGMRKTHLPVEGVTFVVILYACSHSGLVDKGINYFNNMSKEFGIVPAVEHYVCMVDLLGRAGRLDEAMQLIKEMPMEPSPAVWVAVLSACRLHANVELGEYASSQLLQLQSENDGSYTLLSNIYASARRWKDVARIRSLMKYAGIRKRPGCSWVQGKKGTASFFVGDRSHPQSPQINELLADLLQRIKAMGYRPDTSFSLHDVDDEEKGDLLLEHSEKLALAYGILNSSPGATIRITKNLRVCGDCHSAITFISKIVDHKIILRDASRFHHFENGSCSCKGFW
ncbi:Pentatricopeptide repeat [Dillenia turbinata]|uniref:Pentatricopeptide repeat n=1 Tax=Dillenia turbinata TaxID=194707 RepID=A0AAN8VLU8_9MAGN